MKRMNMNKIEKSRQLSYYLRHFTEANIYPGGWIRVNEVLSALKLSFGELKDIVMTDGKRRYSFDGRGRFVRANYGHSIKVDMMYEPVHSEYLIDYQEIYHLYHFTKKENVQSILEEGIKPGKRLYVHLTDDLHSIDYDVAIVVSSYSLTLGNMLFNPVEHIYLTPFVEPSWIETYYD